MSKAHPSILQSAYLAGFLLVGSAVPVVASTAGYKAVECRFSSPSKPAQNMAGKCNVDYGVVGTSGPAFRRIQWPDGVETKIEIRFQQDGNGWNVSTVDGVSAVMKHLCHKGYCAESYRVKGNTIELLGSQDVFAR